VGRVVIVSIADVRAEVRAEAPDGLNGTEQEAATTTSTWARRKYDV